LSDIISKQMTFTYNPATFPADPYELAKMNAIDVYPEWIRSQLVTLTLILIVVNLIFMVAHKQIADFIEKHVPVKRSWIYDMVFGVNLAFSGMVLYVVLRF
jgi:hypothetical protein